MLRLNKFYVVNSHTDPVICSMPWGRI